MKQGDLFGLICVLAIVMLVSNNSQFQAASSTSSIESAAAGGLLSTLPIIPPPAENNNNNKNKNKNSTTTTTVSRIQTRPSQQMSPPEQKEQSDNDDKDSAIAYAITITKCDTLESYMLPGAAVLADLIHKHSVRNPNSTSTYDYKLYAFLAQDNSNSSSSSSSSNVTDTCEALLNRLGYTTLRRPVPIDVSAIHHKTYVHAMNVNGCCGALEFLKLWSYTLTNHRAVVHLDLDVLLLQPLDDMLDVLLLPPHERVAQYERLHVQRDKDYFATATMQAMITRDYSQVSHTQRFKQYRLIPVQGGFFVVKPNITVFTELCNIVQNVNERTWTPHGAWDNKMHSSYWGMPQIQGLLAYYYSYRRAATTHDALELNHCYYNTILGEPKIKGKCATGLDDECEDCRKVDVDKVILAHPVYCHKPWQCIKWHNTKFPRTAPCRYYMNLWTSTIRNAEARWAETLQWDISPQNGDLLPEVYNGYCFQNHSFVPLGFQPDSLLPRS